MRGLLLFVCVAVASAKLHPLSDEFIELINKKQTTWKAGRNFPADTSMESLRRLNGVLDSKDDPNPLPRWTGTIPEGLEIPANFDAREEWPDCPTIAEIRDQGECGSCWAVGAVSVMSDRACIHSEGKENFRYSTENLVACGFGFGCNGGWLGPSFQHWVDNGIVSGGRYNSKEGCQPYSLRECEHHMEGERPPCGDTKPTPSCRKSCIDEYDVSYKGDLHFGETSYSFSLEIEEMQNDIMTNGPVEAAFSVYEDFLSYKSGVYQHVEGSMLGGHAIRVIGWGDEDGTPYWLIANSWNSDWGDKGLFKILRGSNECGIESNVAAGIPKLTG